MARIDRVNSLLKREIANIISTKLHDERIGFVTITDVEVTRDFKYAKVFYSHYGDAKSHKKTLDGLVSASGFIKGEIGSVIRLQNIPDLRFVYDNSIARGVELVNKINKLDES